VYVLSAQGSFTDYSASGPVGSKPPHGHFIMAILDARTLEVIEATIQNSPIDTPRYGAAYPLDLG
jgi:hypothetical protein